MSKVPDQQEFWNKKHLVGEHSEYRAKPSAFLHWAKEFISTGSTVLELGCGVGSDALELSKTAKSILATDFSESVVFSNKKIYSADNIEFSVVDVLNMSHLIDSGKTFDIVYANLSLHYFKDRDTRQVFESIHSLLNDNGLLVFAVKSTDDITYGIGEKIANNTFVSQKGHVRHLFDREYISSLSLNGFTISDYVETEDRLYGVKCNVIWCVLKRNEA